MALELSLLYNNNAPSDSNSNVVVDPPPTLNQTSQIKVTVWNIGSTAGTNVDVRAYVMPLSALRWGSIGERSVTEIVGFIESLAADNGSVEVSLPWNVEGIVPKNYCVFVMALNAQDPFLGGGLVSEAILDRHCGVYNYVISAPHAKAGPIDISSNALASLPAPGVLAGDLRRSTSLSSYGARTGTEQTNIGSPTATALGGTVSINSDGSFTYTPPANATGDDSFGFVLNNPLGSATGKLTLHLVVAPVAIANSFTVSINNQGAGSLIEPAPGLLTGGFLNGGKISSYGILGTEQPTIGDLTACVNHGSVTVNADGSFSYHVVLLPLDDMPDEPLGNASFTYVLTNACGTAEATVTLNLVPAR